MMRAMRSCNNVRSYSPCGGQRNDALWTPRTAGTSWVWPRDEFECGCWQGRDSSGWVRLSFDDADVRAKLLSSRYRYGQH
jgi:hypothetical protein